MFPDTPSDVSDEMGLNYSVHILFGDDMNEINNFDNAASTAACVAGIAQKGWPYVAYGGGLSDDPFSDIEDEPDPFEVHVIINVDDANMDDDDVEIAIRIERVEGGLSIEKYYFAKDGQSTDDCKLEKFADHLVKLIKELSPITIIN